ncbi:MAG: CHC2 zinc finger domain-containing protein [Pseudomonadota bacterium]
MALSDDVKSKVSLAEVAAASVEWDMAKSNPSKGDWWAPCPFHNEKTSSFHISEPGGTRGMFHCFGCHASGSVIDFVMQRDGSSFGDAVNHLADTGGVGRVVDPAEQDRIKRDADRRREKAEKEDRIHAERKLQAASSLWRESVADHPDLTTYLEGRGIRLEAIGGVPPTLRYHPNLAYTSPSTRQVVHRGPAVVAFIGRRKLMGVQRIWIDGDRRASFDNGAKVPKAILGFTGQIKGNPVCLTRPANKLIVGEGIETTLAGLSALRAKGITGYAAEAALSLGALTGPEDKSGRPVGLGRSQKPLPSPVPDLTADKPGWLPPEGTTSITILADPSSKCPDTARLHAERAAAKIAGHGFDYPHTAIPLKHWDHDKDFADLAKSGELYQ